MLAARVYARVYSFTRTRPPCTLGPLLSLSLSLSLSLVALRALPARCILSALGARKRVRRAARFIPHARL